MDAFGRLFVRQRKLLEERDALSSICRFPWPRDHCEWRCDILIILRSNAARLDSSRLQKISSTVQVN
jgi:hypothetical protein